MELTERDRDIIRIVHRYRFLRSNQIVDLLSNGSQQILRRLQLLYHHGYLERPRAQIDYYHNGGSKPIVYGLGNKGAFLLRREYGILLRHLRWSEKNRSVHRIFLEHALFVSDVMVAIELACRKNGKVRLVTEKELLLLGETNQNRQSFHWNVRLSAEIKLGVIPDQVFALEYPDQSGHLDHAFFFLEADRGTMPVVRRNLAQTSFYRKLLAYEATWSQSIHRTRFGFHRFRVLTVTSSAERRGSLVDACSRLKSGHGLFLFGDRTVLDKPKEILSSIWQTGREGEMEGLLN